MEWTVCVFVGAMKGLPRKGRRTGLDISIRPTTRPRQAASMGTSPHAGPRAGPAPLSSGQQGAGHRLVRHQGRDVVAAQDGAHGADLLGPGGDADDHRDLVEPLGLHAHRPFAQVGVNVAPAERSEERRVGKECRSRWSPYH